MNVLIELINKQQCQPPIDIGILVTVRIQIAAAHISGISIGCAQSQICVITQNAPSQLQLINPSLHLKIFN
jgi:hypothetical protein